MKKSSIPHLYENFGCDRNELLFKYCVFNKMYERKKFLCLRSQIRQLEREQKLSDDLSLSLLENINKDDDFHFEI